MLYVSCTELEHSSFHNGDDRSVQCKKKNCTTFDTEPSDMFTCGVSATIRGSILEPIGRQFISTPTQCSELCRECAAPNFYLIQGLSKM